jgi:hypothetical protein
MDKGDTDMPPTTTSRACLALLLIALPALIGVVGPARERSDGHLAPRWGGGRQAPAPWGRDGHVMSGLAAATNLPADMPQFFRDAREQLGYLNYEPDRWRDSNLPELDDAFEYDHFLDLENVPAEALLAQDRFRYLLLLARSGLTDPQRQGGLLPFRMMEMYERLLVEFRLWRREQDPRTKAWIEARIINDAGILGHYAADAANPHHATIHFNGWAEGAPNPNGYTLDRTFHRRFESDFVGARVRVEELLPTLAAPRALPDVRAAVLAHIRASNAAVGRLYDLEKREPFGPNTMSPEHKAFALERLNAGVEMLRSLWWTAWVRSGEP